MAITTAALPGEDSTFTGILVETAWGFGQEAGLPSAGSPPPRSPPLQVHALDWTSRTTMYASSTYVNTSTRWRLLRLHVPVLNMAPILWIRASVIDLTVVQCFDAWFWSKTGMETFG